MSSLEMYLNCFCLHLEFWYFIIHFVFIQLLEMIALNMIGFLNHFEFCLLLILLVLCCISLSLGLHEVLLFSSWFWDLTVPFPLPTIKHHVFVDVFIHWVPVWRIHTNPCFHGSPCNPVINKYSQWWSLGQVRNPYLNINEWEMDDFMISDLSALIH